MKHLPLFAWMFMLLANASALVACQSKQPENAYAPPALVVSPGMPTFKVIKDEVSTDKERVVLVLALTGAAEHDALEALLKDIYRQAMTRIGMEPSSVQIIVHANEER